MTLNEFKAWFEGFSENLGEVPTKAQWKRIKARIDEIDGWPGSPLIVERHYEFYRRYWPYSYPITTFSTNDAQPQYMAAIGAADASALADHSTG